MEILQAPDDFRPPYKGYPFHSRGPSMEVAFYDWALKHHQSIETDLIYIPIHWWSLNVHNRKVKGTPDFEADPFVQKFLDEKLDPSKSYFTVSQCDDGVYETLPPNVLVFSAGGTGDIPIPLLCDPHPVFSMPRDVKCFFMGAKECGGPVKGQKGRSGWDPNGAGAILRRRMFEVLQGRPNWDLRDTTGQGVKNLQNFRHMMSRSQFCLAPRGYGRSSFRFYEAIQMGCIPIHIWDDIEWLPYKDVIAWDDVIISCNVADLPKLPEIVDGKDPKWIENAQENLRLMYPHFFTYRGASAQIDRMVGQRSGWKRS